MISCRYLFSLLLAISCCQSANILYAIPFPVRSHYNLLRPIGLELARRGHNVTVITGNIETDHAPTYHQVMADNRPIWEFVEGGRPNIFSLVDLSSEEFHSKIYWAGGLISSEMAFKSPKVQEFLKEDRHFDVVIAQLYFLDAWYALAHRYNAPLILVTTQGNCMRHNFVSGNPLQIPTVVSEFHTVDQPKTFWGRLRNFSFTMYELFWWKFWYIGKQEELARKYIPNMPANMPSLDEIQKNASLVLVNSHFSFDTPMAYVPNQVEIGGIHLTHKFDPLPEDLQKLLDESKYGVIYMSFGSNVRSSELPVDKKNAFLNVFRKLKYTVLWKWEEENLEGKPDNVFVRKWLPQKEILAHPKIKLFISHGGLIGTQEALFHGVPVIGVPVYADQYNNLLEIQEAGMGRVLKYHDINENNVENTLQMVLEDESYMEKAKEISRRFQDRPMSALDTAMFWIEYVIRHKGADFMKNPAMKLNWFAYYMIDIMAYILVILAVFTFILIKVVNVLILVKHTLSRNKPKSE